MSNERIEKIRKRVEQMQSVLRDLEARDKDIERKRDTRRKILVGAYLLQQAESNNTKNELLVKLDKFLTRDSDRALFDLKPQKVPNEHKAEKNK